MYEGDIFIVVDFSSLGWRIDGDSIAFALG